MLVSGISLFVASDVRRGLDGDRRTRRRDGCESFAGLQWIFGRRFGPRAPRACDKDGPASLHNSRISDCYFPLPLQVRKHGCSKLYLTARYYETRAHVKSYDPDGRWVLQGGKPRFARWQISPFVKRCSLIANRRVSAVCARFRNAVNIVCLIHRQTVLDAWSQAAIRGYVWSCVSWNKESTFSRITSVSLVRTVVIRVSRNFSLHLPLFDKWRFIW